MAKLNYANRKSEGFKLAQIVAKDLRKKAAASPSKSDNSPIELHLEGKAIPDDGLKEISEALVEVLQVAHTGHRSNCQLEQLHLQHNDISALGLRHLAPAIRMAGRWLTTLNVSRNKILVQTVDECAAWECFLEAFDGCRTLRLLNLGDNDFSGPRAFEILTRVYFRHPPYDPAATSRREVKFEDVVQAETSQIITSLNDLTISGDGNTCRGLRYVPYIILTGVSMDDSGCFQLSYILSRHVQPQHLLETMQSGPAKHHLDSFDHASKCSGIIYDTAHLSTYGIKLLDECEKQRGDLTSTKVQDEEDDSFEQITPAREERPPTPPSAFASMLAPRHKYGTPRRRSSIVSGDSGKAAGLASGRKGSTFDVESLRWKLQRETIDKHGVNSVELWETAIKLLNVARAILPPTEDKHTGSLTMSAPAHSSFPQTSLSTPTRHFVRKDSPQRSSNKGKQPQHALVKEQQDTKLASGLPLDIWQRIMVDAVDPQHILSETQVGNVLAYAADRTTLSKERESVRNHSSSQKWMVIDGMGCLAYEMPL